MTTYIPPEIGATSVPIPNNRRADIVAHHTAAGLMQTDTVSVIHTIKDGFVHTIFAKGSSFPADPAENDFETTLAIALPGHPDHQGDGVYIANATSGLAAIRTVANRVSAYQGESELVRAWAADQNLPVYDLPDEGGSKWTLPQYQRAQRVNRVLFALAIAGIAFTIFSGFNLTDTITRSQAAERDTEQIRRTSTAYENQLRQKLVEVTDQPALAIIGRLYALGRINPETGGTLLNFRASNGAISWVAQVPDWVSNEQIDRFGPNIDRTRMDDKKMLRLTATEEIQ
jgi:hypothetical protein